MEEQILTPEDGLLKKWTLILGVLPGSNPDLENVEWDKEDERINEVLDWVYSQDDDAPSKMRSSYINEWIKDVNQFFPHQVSEVLQKDAITKFGAELLLKSDAFADQVIPNVQLAATLLKIKGLLPDTARHKAGIIIKKIVDRLINQFRFDSTKAIGRALRMPVMTPKPKLNHINWGKTILKNLSTFDNSTKTIIPEKMVGRKFYKKSIDTLYIIVDQSGSMASSLIFAAIYACIFNSIPALNTHLVLFDTDVVDMTHLIYDPLELLLSAQLGGGTNIGAALQYVNSTAQDPERALVVLISDLEETQDEEEMLRQAYRTQSRFKKFISILALDDEGVGVWDKHNAQKFTNMDIMTIACTPDVFPELLANEIAASRLN